MPQELNQKQTNPMQTVTLIDRCALCVTGVNDVVRFEEESILLDTVQGLLEVDGTELRIAKLDPEKKEIRLNGTVSALFYTEGSAKKRGLFRR
jgi:sporulation protein YabP